ncbi:MULTISPECIES: iron uptake transporter deferrochelatase/peroxidase subunit [unclassified Leifsonia]|uniref:iron uptake transporter deferrochelatase/peroxidase subunit n=1 Tax=unclassified Leifsonia TaxID=2663824 RepID=UPI0008A72267|nr:MULTISPECIES: iron uptake transporter deferrochelatase/peroxidase subunit [unclassified Leifsonia]SEH90793.1 deferrochelatase/peroxidase EfeB [Leifsonia sp. CL154]SFL53303.1 deferrochelatase/peroxidase EfeB [Leifsonia sp. CL147]
MSSEDRPTLSRRAALGLAGATVGAGVVGIGAGVAADRAVLGASTASSTTYPFYGAQQAGITTPAQDRLHFAAFDAAPGLDRDGLIELLHDWTVAAARMTQGRPAGKYGPASGPMDAPPDDTGEALDLPAAGLTLTFGFGPTLFRTAAGEDRFGIASRRPAALVDLPRFPGDALVEAISGGDLCVQACSDDPQVAVHAIRNLSRIAFGRAAIRWSQLGFGRTSSTSRAQVTPRNLFGFKDGTANIKSEDASIVEDQVWAGSGDGAPWMAGGSYLVARKIRMVIETWDRQQLGEQERIIGRDKGEGAPLSGGTEFTAPNFLALAKDGGTKIDPASHVRLAHPSVNSGAQLLRRGYNFVDGNDELGRLNAGLFFIAFQRDPRKQFIPIQQRLASSDLMNEYTRHVGSGVFAVPPGAKEGSFVGAGLFA